MTPDGPLFLVNPAIDLATIVITATSAAYIARQRASEYNQVKEALIAVHVLYIALVTLEFIRIFYSTPDYMIVYTTGNTTFVLLDVALLTTVALAIYYKLEGQGLRGILKELVKHRRQFIFFSLFALYLVAAEIILLASRPYTLVVLRNMVGLEVNSTVFSGTYLNVLLGVLVVFIIYPSTLLFLTSKKTSDPIVKRALILLPVSWIGIGAVILIFNGYVLTVTRTDDSAIAYLIAATAFSASASTFRRATLLSGFFTFSASSTALTKRGEVRPILETLGIGFESLAGHDILLEVEPISPFEGAVRDIAGEFSSRGYAIFAFTARGSPIYSSLEKLEGARFLLMTDRVSYARPGAAQNEMLVPKYEFSVLLDAMDKTINANRASPIIILFDDLTNLVLTIGLEATYKFLKQANGLLSASKTTAIFVISSTALGAKENNAIRALFNDRMLYDRSGLVLSEA